MHIRNKTERRNEDDEGNIITYEGIAPSANVILTPVADSLQLIRAIENLATAGCAIINLSLGFGSTPDYTAVDKQVDLAVSSSKVVIVKSAGNLKKDEDKNVKPETINISSPGKAANVITVGNAETKSTVFISTFAPYKASESSSYTENDSYLFNKPDI